MPLVLIVYRWEAGQQVTHDLGDIEELCQRVMIIDAGRLIYDGPISTLKARFGKYREITFETAQAVGPLMLPDGVEVIAAEERKLRLRFDRTHTTVSRVTADDEADRGA